MAEAEYQVLGEEPARSPWRFSKVRAVLLVLLLAALMLIMLKLGVYHPRVILCIFGPRNHTCHDVERSLNSSSELALPLSYDLETHTANNGSSRRMNYSGVSEIFWPVTTTLSENDERLEKEHSTLFLEEVSDDVNKVTTSATSAVSYFSGNEILSVSVSEMSSDHDSVDTHQHEDEKNSKSFESNDELGIELSTKVISTSQLKENHSLYVTERNLVDDVLIEVSTSFASSILGSTSELVLYAPLLDLNKESERSAIPQIMLNKVGNFGTSYEATKTNFTIAESVPVSSFAVPEDFRQPTNLDHNLNTVQSIEAELPYSWSEKNIPIFQGVEQLETFSTRNEAFQNSDLHNHSKSSQRLSELFEIQSFAIEVEKSTHSLGVHNMVSILSSTLELGKSFKNSPVTIAPTSSLNTTQIEAEVEFVAIRELDEMSEN